MTETLKKYRYSSKNKNIVRWLKMLSDDYSFENKVFPDSPISPGKQVYICSKKHEKGEFITFEILGFKKQKNASIPLSIEAYGLGKSHRFTAFSRLLHNVRSLYKLMEPLNKSRPTG